MRSLPLAYSPKVASTKSRSAAPRYLLPGGALASEGQYRACERTCGVYTAVAQDAKLEILGTGSI